MNENVVDILIYLYENYMDNDHNSSSDQDVIQEELIQAGFPESEIAKAFQWMEELAVRQGTEDLSRTNNSIRIYTEDEKSRLDTDCRGLLLFLEHTSILDPANRELVIDRAMALDTAQVGVEELKWIVLMVLVNQPGQETAFAQMENLVYNEIPAYLH